MSKGHQIPYLVESVIRIEQVESILPIRRIFPFLGIWGDRILSRILGETLTWRMVG
jgi:hypothetical protein